MCCFTELVEKVSDTSIFARIVRGNRQIVVYGMSYAAKQELAMVLPIPVTADAPEDAVRFIDLEDCPGFFAQMRDGFLQPDRITLGGDDLGAVITEKRTLRVHDVGAFEASFVPTPADFGRLDARFRLPVPIWLHLNHYRDWGFAVFKLKPTALARVHPMAFEFPTRDAARLFFPTLHLHGKALEARAEFDHTLYCQPEPAMSWHLESWRDSEGPASEFMLCEAGRALVDLDFPCWKLDIEGLRENRDTWVGAGEVPPR